jgi:hypothetical protein
MHGRGIAARETGCAVQIMQRAQEGERVCVRFTPRKRTPPNMVIMSALCQERSWVTGYDDETSQLFRVRYITKHSRKLGV